VKSWVVDPATSRRYRLVSGLGPGASAPPALVKSAKGTSSSATINPAFGSATTSGNLIVLAIASDAYNGTPDAGWTQSSGMETLGNHGGYIWWRISTGQTSFTYTIGGAVKSAWVLAEFSNINASPYDISASQFVNTGGGNYTTPNITPTTGSRLLVGVIGGSGASDFSAATWHSWTNSFTAVDSIGSGTSGNNCLVGMSYQLVTGNGSTAFSTGAFSTPDTPQSLSGLIISFKGA
jgi:hypothetical protein